MRHPQTVDGGRTCRVAAQVKDTPAQRQMCGVGSLKKCPSRYAAIGPVVAFKAKPELAFEHMWRTAF